MHDVGFRGLGLRVSSALYRVLHRVFRESFPGIYSLFSGRGSRVVVYWLRTTMPSSFLSQPAHMYT